MNGVGFSARFLLRLRPPDLLDRLREPVGYQVRVPFRGRGCLVAEHTGDRVEIDSGVDHFGRGTMSQIVEADVEMA